jgi:hypothetical protein
MKLKEAGGIFDLFLYSYPEVMKEKQYKYD